MSYVVRIQNAIDYIEENLLEELQLIHIAKQANFSPYHFHRIFSATVGETIKTYIRKRRLTEAAYELRRDESRIIDIAIKYQYESQESFTRAFKKMFNVPPGDYRNLSTFPAHFEKSKLSEEAIMHRAYGIEVKANIVSMETFWVVGLEYVGPVTFQGDLWDQFIPRMKEIKNATGKGVSYGVCYATPDMCQEGEVSYMASLPVTKAEDVPDGMVARKVDGGNFAVITHKGAISKISDTIDFVYNSWLPKSGYEVDDRADLELYDNRFMGEDDASEFDLLIPIK
jgi:AraC family transcriptional regulator